MTTLAKPDCNRVICTHGPSQEARVLKLTLHISRLKQVQHSFGLSPVGQHYRVRANDGRERDVAFPLTQAQLDHLSSLRNVDANELQQVGDGLRQFLEPAGWDSLERDLRMALPESKPDLEAGKHVFIIVSIRSAAAEILALPWELLVLQATGQRLGELPGVLLRYEWVGTNTVPWKGDPTVDKGRILFAFSTAGGAVPAAPQIQDLEAACSSLGLSFSRTRDVLSDCSLEGLNAALSETPTAVLHLLCHGAPLASRARIFGLKLDADTPGGGERVVDGPTLVAKLQPHVGVLRLVVICACDSGNLGSPDNWLGSIAQELHRAGIPAVVASRYPLSQSGGVLLTQVLYQRLLGECASLEESVLAARQALSIGSSHPFEWASLQFHAREADGEDTRPVPIRPYRGLKSFEARHRIFFKGRQEVAGRLLKRMKEAIEGRRPRLQAVAGTSGTGKSSLVAAGLLPTLKEQGWRWVHLRPEPAPVKGLARELAKLRGAAPDGANPVEEARRFFEASPQGRLLVFIDQFEELFTRVEPQSERSSFVQALWALEEAGLHLVVLVSFRLDFISACRDLVNPQTGARLDALLLHDVHTEFVMSPTPEAFPSIIEKPAMQVGLRIEPGLVERLVQDTGRAEALPLLEFALEKLWENREGRWLTNRAYDSLLTDKTQDAAGVGQDVNALIRIFTSFADTLLAQFPSEKEREFSRRLFLQLVNPGLRPIEHTRRRMRVEVWRPQKEEESKIFDSVLEQWVKARLVVTGRDDAGVWAEVSHEALLQYWKTLHHWIEETRTVLGICQEVRHHSLTRDRLPLRVRRAARRIIQEHPYLLEPELQAYVRADSRRKAFNVAMVLSGLAVLFGTLGYVAWSWWMNGYRQKDQLIQAALPRVQEDPTLLALLLKEVHDTKEVVDWRLWTLKALAQPLAEIVPADEFPVWFALNAHSSRLPMREGDTGASLPAVDGGVISREMCAQIQHIWSVETDEGVPSRLAVACSSGTRDGHVNIFETADPRSFSFSPAGTIARPVEVHASSPQD